MKMQIVKMFPEVLFVHANLDILVMEQTAVVRADKQALI